MYVHLIISRLEIVDLQPYYFATAYCWLKLAENADEDKFWKT